MHGHWFVSLGQQEHAFSGSVLHFIQVTWFAYVFANIRRVPNWVQCRMQLRPSDIVVSPHILRLFQWFPY